MVAEHTWTWRALALSCTGTAAEGRQVSMIKGSLGVTLDIFCNLEKCTSCMVACSKQALHSVVRNAAGDTWGRGAVLQRAEKCEVSSEGSLCLLVSPKGRSVQAQQSS